ncbi:hemerythrin domain-containing protein [Novosphingobium sp. KACC 22771]|uniref:hemerythrin domain-containing protein n=1 Tax=Novosphingobium sp. KACC 22771 TaxID=3025670 RepID=UPI0023654F5F|nr:hemerythrin domain-containing protein [Novosphingobium sp. KACC 22771]WDF71429.1 hemerythrin domain-containing protein [Novosphingobium sp. KACC 22771]
MATSTPQNAEAGKNAAATKAQNPAQKPAEPKSAQDPAEGARPDKAEHAPDQAKASSSGQPPADSERAKRKAHTPSEGAVSALLMADHRAVEKLFAEYEDADAGRQRAIIDEATQALILHTMLEEEIFYPACREHFSDEDELDDAQVEHDSVKILIDDLMRGSRDDPYRDAKFRVLAEQVHHHVCEEEQAGGIFHKAQACGIDTPELAKRIKARRSELEEDGPFAPPSPISLRGGARSGLRRDERRPVGRSEEERGHTRYTKEKEMASYQQYRDHDRDDRGRFARSRDEDDHRSMRGGNDRPRDEDGRFTSRGREDSGGREGDGGYGRRGEQRYRRDDEDDDHETGRHGRSGSGWYGDPEGHSQASRRGWENSDHGRSGWYGDPEGHSQASRRGWDERGASRGRDYDDRDDGRSRSRDHDDRGYSSRGGHDDRDDGRHERHGGWSGDPRGHAEAARRGWENRR